MKVAKSSMPRAVSRRIMQRAANGDRALVVVIKKGKPSRVFGLKQYQDRQALTRKVKPWERRKGKTDLPNPLGAVKGTVLVPLTRDNIYE